MLYAQFHEFYLHTTDVSLLVRRSVLSISTAEIFVFEYQNDQNIQSQILLVKY